MLFVSFLSTFVLGQLSTQMAALEFQHEVQVEDQMSVLQTAVLESVAALSGNGSTYLSSPVTLSSSGSPPFGTPSSGSLLVESDKVATTASFGLSNVSAATVGWNHGSACFGAGSSTCTNGTGTEVFNFSGNHSTATPEVNGCAVAGCNVVYNVTGSFDTLGLTLAGAYLQHILVQISGNWDNLTLSDGGSCNIRQLVSVVFSGNNDTYALTMTGCSTGVGANLNTTFVGSAGSSCPYGNAASYDLWKGATWGSSAKIYQNLTWQNAFGITSPPNSIPANGGADQLTFANQSGYFQCLFTTAKTTGPYDLHFLSGVQTVLNNRYIQPASVAYEQGAVILGIQNGGSVMVSPPSTSLVQQPYGISFAVELVSLVTTQGYVTGSGVSTGYGTAAVITNILSNQVYSIQDGKHGNNYVPYFYLNFTTPYPQAWATFWESQGPAVPAGVSCVPGAGVTLAQCMTPPFGRLSTIVVPINAAQFTLESVVVQVSIY